MDYHPVTNPVGRALQAEELHPGRRSLFTRFDNYYKSGKPYADELEIIDFKDQVSRLAALRAGQIDMANGMPSEQLDLLRNDPRIKLVTSVTGNWLSFDMNTAKAPFDDPRVRAFRLLADREELVRRALSARAASPTTSTRPSTPPSTTPWRRARTTRSVPANCCAKPGTRTSKWNWSPPSAPASPRPWCWPNRPSASASPSRCARSTSPPSRGRSAPNGH